MSRSPEEVTRQLVDGSLAVIVDNEPLAQTVRRSNPGVVVYSLESRNGTDRSLAEAVMMDYLGLVPTKRPKMHFQIDVLVLGAGVDDRIGNQLIPYCHANGWIFRPDGSVEQFAPDPNWDVAIAKLKPTEKQYLHNAVKRLPAGSVYVEIGTYKGGSAVLAASSNPGVRVFAVDIWAGENPDFEVFQRHTQFFDNITPIKVDREALDQGPKLIAEQLGVNLDELQIDLLFIDGDHSFKGLLTDLIVYEPYARRVCGHDHGLGNPVEAAVEYYYGSGWASRLWTRLPNQFRGRVHKYFRKEVRRQGGDSSIWHCP